MASSSKDEQIFESKDQMSLSSQKIVLPTELLKDIQDTEAKGCLDNDSSDGFFYIPNFITEAEEEHIIDKEAIPFGYLSICLSRCRSNRQRLLITRGSAYKFFLHGIAERQEDDQQHLATVTNGDMILHPTFRDAVIQAKDASSSHPLQRQLRYSLTLRDVERVAPKNLWR
ncbi:hypothetical protein IEQ34_025275 [Dendrobium chrysotoxum]|uniref:Uncharacterized protein n=1 Tax=Dendrobium chrysotoxum TaxID=161865 RepID=A0AAV7FJ28_DENCH|nr:hypothetical protein IEQ34_025275 [Dendrobium chrysotoxum]